MGSRNKYPTRSATRSFNPGGASSIQGLGGLQQERRMLHTLRLHLFLFIGGLWVKTCATSCMAHSSEDAIKAKSYGTAENMQRFSNRPRCRRQVEGMTHDHTCGFPEVRGTFLRDLIVRIDYFEGLYWGPPVYGNYRLDPDTKIPLRLPVREGF